MNHLAPIGVSTYSRLNHLKQTIAALKDNYLAEESDLYIFSDAPRKGDEEAVARVRSFAKTIHGFKGVHVIERKQNNRVQNNRGGMQKLLNDYGRIIFLEEDIVTSESFLTYMNEALDKYKDEKKIISISGYCPPITIPKSYDKDVFLLKRFNAWGFGTWSHKFDPFSYTIDLDEYKKNIHQLRPVMKRYGKDILNLIRADASGNIDALDVKLMYHQIKNNLYTVYPTNSMTINIGFDGSGLHCGKSEAFKTHLANKKLAVDLLEKENQKIVEKHRKFRNRIRKNFINRAINKFRSLLKSKIINQVSFFSK